MSGNVIVDCRESIRGGREASGSAPVTTVHWWSGEYLSDVNKLGVSSHFSR